MQAVELVGRHVVEHALDLGHAEEMPRHVDVLAAPGKARCVADGQRRDAERRFLMSVETSRRQHLQKRLRGIEGTVWTGRGDLDLRLVHLQAVGTIDRTHRRVEDEADAAWATRCHLQAQPLGQVARGARQLVGRVDLHRAIDHERRRLLQQFKRLRLRQQRVRRNAGDGRGRGLRLQRQSQGQQGQALLEIWHGFSSRAS